MSPPTFRLGWYLCPECGARVEEAGGPDGLHACRCSECDWGTVYDPNAHEWATEALERVPKEERSGCSA